MARKTALRSHSPDSLRFVFDGDVLGESAADIDTAIKPD
jgi:hypothetical protein